MNGDQANCTEKTNPDACMTDQECDLRDFLYGEQHSIPEDLSKTK